MGQATFLSTACDSWAQREDYTMLENAMAGTGRCFAATGWKLDYWEVSVKLYALYDPVSAMGVSGVVSVSVAPLTSSTGMVGATKGSSMVISVN